VALSYTTDSLIASIRSRCYENVGALNDAKVLRIMNEELIAYLVPFIEAARTDQFTRHVDTAIVDSQSAYYVPSVALGNRIRDISLVDSAGAFFAPLTELDLDVLVQGPQTSQFGIPTGYYFEGDRLILYPTPSGTGGYSFRLYYSRRPNELILTADCQAVTASSTVGGATRLTVADSSDFAVSQLVDLVSALSPFGVPVENVAVTNIPDATHVDIGIVPVAPATTLLAAGPYYLCPTGQAPVPTGVPGEILTGLFVQWMVARLMAARGDSGAYDKAMKDTMAAEARAKLLLRQRNKGDTHQALSLPYRFKGGWGGYRRAW
jgi:hypothetical protein